MDFSPKGLRLIRAIVFDFDGTLAELHIDFDEMKSRLESLASEYVPITWKAPLPPVLELLTILTGKVVELRNGGAAEFQARANALITGIEVEAAAKGRLFPFTRNLFRKLERRGIKSAIITRNCEQGVRMVFPDLDTYCTHLLSREHVKRVKPHPDHLLEALQLIGSTPEAALMVGDHPLDIETGLRAGTLTGGVASGRMSKEELASTGAHWTADDCESLLTLLEGEGVLLDSGL
jgi:phosphoglycolate phosphatase